MLAGVRRQTQQDHEQSSWVQGWIKARNERTHIETLKGEIYQPLVADQTVQELLPDILTNNLDEVDNIVRNRGGVAPTDEPVMRVQACIELMQIWNISCTLSDHYEYILLRINPAR